MLVFPQVSGLILRPPHQPPTAFPQVNRCEFESPGTRATAGHRAFPTESAQPTGSTDRSQVLSFCWQCGFPAHRSTVTRAEPTTKSHATSLLSVRSRQHETGPNSVRRPEVVPRQAARPSCCARPFPWGPDPHVRFHGASDQCGPGRSSPLRVSRVGQRPAARGGR